MEKFKNIVGDIKLERQEDGYNIHDEECFICGTLGINETKLNELINRSNLYKNAIELLKEFAFYCVDLSVQEHCEQAMKVQSFLRETGCEKWIDEQIAENEKDMD